MWSLAGLECYSKEKTTIFPEVEPWNWDTADMDVEFSTDLIGCMGKQDSQTNIFDKKCVQLIFASSNTDIIIINFLVSDPIL